MIDATPSPDPRLAQALVAAERRLAMLERLTEMGMAIAGELTEKVVEFPHRAGSGPEAVRAFAGVSRAVRLTLMLTARVEKAILAMRKGELGLEPAVFAETAVETPEVRGERVRAVISPAIEREAADAEDAWNLTRRMEQRLDERDEFGGLLSRPFEECIATICQDLGLDAEAILADGMVDVPVDPRTSARPLRGGDEDVAGPVVAPVGVNQLE